MARSISTGGSPTLFFSYAAGEVSNATYVQGGHPAAPGQVSIIQKLAKDENLGIGSRIDVITPGGSETVTVSGIFTFGAESSLGGSILVDTTLADAQRWFDMKGSVSTIDVKAEAGVSPDVLAARVRAALPPYADVKTGTQAATDQTKQLSDAIGGFLRPVLLSFGGIAVLVGAFIIFNAFSMTVAQRRREFAMLRALGAIAPAGPCLGHRRGARDGHPCLCSRHPRRTRDRRRDPSALRGGQYRHPP